MTERTTLFDFAFCGIGIIGKIGNKQKRQEKTAHSTNENRKIVFLAATERKERIHEDHRRKIYQPIDRFWIQKIIWDRAK
jgi:hypothetical protein